MSDLWLTHDARRACFSAAAVAGASGESEISARRIASALLRDQMVTAFCSAPGVLEALIARIDGKGRESFQRAIESIERSLAATGESFGSTSHIGSIKLLPLSPAMKKAFESLAERAAVIGSPSSAIELLIAVLEQEPQLRDDFANPGISLEALRHHRR